VTKPGPKPAKSPTPASRTSGQRDPQRPHGRGWCVHRDSCQGSDGLDQLNRSPDVQFQPKSYEYGIAKAKEEGITDTAEIHNRALAWMQEEPGIWPQRLMGVGQAVGWMPKAFKDAISHTPALGILNPFPTSPANITKAAMRATGVGGLFVDTFYRDVFSEDRNTRSRAIGEIATAYMTLVGGVMLATSGFVEFSGPGSYNAQTKAKMQRLGIQMYSIRFKNPPLVTRHGGGIYRPWTPSATSSR
jgi:hypothetical protein